MIAFSDPSPGQTPPPHPTGCTSDRDPATTTASVQGQTRSEEVGGRNSVPLPRESSRTGSHQAKLWSAAARRRFPPARLDASEDRTSIGQECGLGPVKPGQKKAASSRRTPNLPPVSSVTEARCASVYPPSSFPVELRGRELLGYGNGVGRVVAAVGGSLGRCPAMAGRGGKSEHYRAGCFLTGRRGDPTESATENIPPPRRGERPEARSKRREARRERTGSCGFNFQPPTSRLSPLLGGKGEKVR